MFWLIRVLFGPTRGWLRVIKIVQVVVQGRARIHNMVPRRVWWLFRFGRGNLRGILGRTMNLTRVVLQARRVRVEARRRIWAIHHLYRLDSTTGFRGFVQIFGGCVRFAAEEEVWSTSLCFCKDFWKSSRRLLNASNILAWKAPIFWSICMSKREDRDFSRFTCTFSCKAVPGVGGTVQAGVRMDKASNERGWGWGGDVKRRSAAISSSAYEPPNDSIELSPNNSKPMSSALSFLSDFLE